MTRQRAELMTRAPRASVLPSFVLDRARALERNFTTAGCLPADVGARVISAADKALGVSRLSRSNVGARSVGAIERDQYTIQKLAFEGVPGLPVPAHLYLPRAPAPWPGVVHAVGHWMENGKLEPDVQRLNILLVRHGMAVLCFDPLGQGERRIGWHQHGQLATHLVGLTSLGVMVCENRAAVDVLHDHPGVDDDRIGMTGTSGGGLTTLFASALDDRLRSAAVCCIINTQVGFIEAGLGTGWDGFVDLCCQIPGFCTIGSMAEIVACRAPRDFLAIHATSDPAFPVENARAVAEEAGALYTAAGHAAGFVFVEVPGGHGLFGPQRSATLAFFARTLACEAVTPEAEARLLEPPYSVTHDVARATDDLRQTFARPSRSVSECFDQQVDTNAPLVAMARKRAMELRMRRRTLDAGSLERALGGFPDPSPTRVFIQDQVPLPEGGYGERLSFQSEPGVELDALLFLSENWSDEAPPVVIVLDEGGKQQALDSLEARHALERGAAVFVPDLRGTGESAACEFELASGAWMLDRDLLNQRVWDTLRSVDVLSERYSTGQQIDKSRIVVWGIESFSVVALIAGALDPRLAAVGARATFASLEDLLAERPRLSPMLFHFRLLELVDFDDLKRMISPRVAETVSRDAEVGEALDSVLEELSR
jgi:cephalosporin-C deacetylase-like acetyl esterase